ncbi:Lipase family protein [Trichomonas vaginalis G3]|uniref:Lipase family protein n=1 Tax=Trichomonas vaginalis (strain ATCC PRA-98 / G3) TaxID=412133 RepID=A2DFQ4_TRIV3|nr:lipase [Trichomonas vaginalis G3]EAY20757.1 Lipase family protein [Trichomonas vaginalis G3]KAI5529457.1 retrograde trans-synaptic signaling by lipid [Trichomonas vaginalis G3]|eukprot:XP_001581743.1 lipase [Trichomonas vaginalis G3]
MSEVVFFSNIIEYMASHGRNGLLPRKLKCIFNFKGTNGIPTFNVMKYKNERYIWVKGTNFASHNDLSIDLHTVETPFLNGYAHSGFLNAARMVLSLVTGLIENHERVVCLGHSLGGAVATMIAMILKYENKWDNVQAFTFGTPGILSADLQEKSKLICTTFVRSKDPIPRIFKIKKGIYNFFKFNVGKYCRELFMNKYETLEESNESRIGDIVPGRVIIIEKKDDEPICRRPVPADFELRKKLRMMSHSHKKYHRDLLHIYHDDELDKAFHYRKIKLSAFLNKSMTVLNSRIVGVGVTGAVSTVLLTIFLGPVGAIVGFCLTTTLVLTYAGIKKPIKIHNSSQ